MRGLLKLTWLEIKIFLREPLGAFGTVAMPVLAFVVLGRIAGRGLSAATTPGSPGNKLVSVSFPVFSTVLIAISSFREIVSARAVTCPSRNTKLCTCMCELPNFPRLGSFWPIGKPAYVPTKIVRGWSPEINAVSPCE